MPKSPAALFALPAQTHVVHVPQDVGFHMRMMLSQQSSRKGWQNETLKRKRGASGEPYLPFFLPPPPALPPFPPLPPAAAAAPAAFLPPLPLPPSSSRPFLLIPFCFNRYRSSRAAAWWRSKNCSSLWPWMHNG